MDELQTLQESWLNAKAEEDKAKQARLLVEEMILEKIGYTTGDPNFKSWKDKIKITFGQKEEYEQEALINFFRERPQNLLAPSCPFRIKLEPDAKKMLEFKVEHNELYMREFAPICSVKYAKPSFSAVVNKDTKGA